MKTLKQYQDDYKRLVKSDRNFRGFLARMGRTDGVIDAGNGNVYVVTLDGQTLTIPNRRLPLAIKPVFIGMAPEDPDTLQVLSTWEAYSDPWPSGAQPHAYQHGYSSFDPDWVEIERLKWMLCLPAPDLGAFYIRLYGGNLVMDDVSITVDNQTLDLSASVPSVGALYVLIQIDSAGIMTAKVGTVVDGQAALAASDIPDPDAGNFASCAIKLYESQALLQRDIRSNRINDFVDLRFSKNSPLIHYPVMYVGHGAPNDAFGVDGDGWLDLDGQNVYEKETGPCSNWILIFSINPPAFVAEDLSSQVNGITDHFDISVEAVAIDVFVNGVLEYSSNVTLDVDGLGFTLSYVPPSGTILEVRINKPDDAFIVQTTIVSSIIVEEIDGSPSVNNVEKIKVQNGTLIDEGAGIVSIKEIHAKVVPAAGDHTITTITDISGMSLTFNMVSGLTYEYVFSPNMVKSTTGTVTISLTDGSNNIKDQRLISMTNGFQRGDAISFIEVAGSTGSVTRKLRASVDAGSVVFTDSGNVHPYFYVRCIG